MSLQAATSPSTSSAPGPATDQSRMLDHAIVAAIELVGAYLLAVFLLSRTTWLIVLVLALFGAALVGMRLRPVIEERIVGAFRRAWVTGLVLGAVIVLAYPFLLKGNSYAIHMLIIGQIYAVLALALNFQLGSANIPNFATGASYGIGAYTSGLLAVGFGVSFWLTLPVAAAVATFFGFVIGFPSMRTRDTYLALVTIAFAVVVHQLMNNFEWTGGRTGWWASPRPRSSGTRSTAPSRFSATARRGRPTSTIWPWR